MSIYVQLGGIDLYLFVRMYYVTVRDNETSNSNTVEE